MEMNRILVIDDEKTICDGCRLALLDKGYSVQICMTGRAALDVLREEIYDVVLLDLKLPDIQGMEILKTLRRESPGLYIIIMTGYSTVQNAVEAMKSGAFDYLAKPFSDDELLFTVERAIEKKQLLAENEFLRKELIGRFGFNNIVGEDPKILRLFEAVNKAAPTDTTILINGESGTGKELFARAVHAHSLRATCQFVAVDCSTLALPLLESELFGHVKGAFTGAVQDKQGIFEMAHGGTLFLDDVANLNMEIQGELLRVLEAQEYKPVGGNRFRTSNVRIIAATNQDLKGMVDAGRFREDLFYRLNVFPLFLPPLRERRGDIPKLAYFFLRLFCRKTGKQVEGFSDDALEMLVGYDWPGNVRQLKNVIEHLVIMADGRTLDLLYLFDHLQTRRSWQTDPIPQTVEELRAAKRRLLKETFGQTEKAFLIKALKACNGNITRAAKRVGMKRPNFATLMKKHHVNAKATRISAE